MLAEVKTILLVEDDPNDALLIQRAFRAARILNPIQAVDNGEDAIDYLGGTGKYSDRSAFPIPMLILLDLKLPRRNGLEVLTWVREQAMLKRVPIVVLTSSRESSDINKAYDLGANSYLVKPVAYSDLLEMVKTIEMYWLVLNEKPGLA